MRKTAKKAGGHAVCYSPRESHLMGWNGKRDVGGWTNDAIKDDGAMREAFIV